MNKIKRKSSCKVLSAQRLQGCFQAARLRVAQFFRIVPAACFRLSNAVSCRLTGMLEEPSRLQQVFVQRVKGKGGWVRRKASSFLVI